MTFLLLAVLLIEIGIAGPVKVHCAGRIPGVPSPLFEEDPSFTFPEDALPRGLSNCLAMSELRSHLPEIMGTAENCGVVISL